MAEPVPGEVARFLALIGEAATLRLVELHGGTRLTIPAGGAARNRIARELGAEAARALFAEFGHERIRVPLAKSWRARIYRTQGLSYRQIALRLGCNEPTVWRYLHQAPSRQLEFALT
jgi:predicted DNA-binding protein (UPF0251 family)